MILDKFKLDGKVALVTGAGSGLGKEMAIGLAEAGADVAVLGRRQEAVAAAAGEIEKQGRKSLAIPASVTDPDAVKSAVSSVESGLGPIDILVNGAGVFNGEDTLSIPPENWREVIDINLNGAFICAQAAGAGMVARKRGSIINVGSFLGFRGQRAGRAAYNASKAGVIAFTRALSLEWGPHGVRVNCISPGVHRTPMTEGALSNPEAKKWLEEKTVLGRIGEADDPAGLCVFLASDASAYITGENIFEDGGGWL